MIIFWLLVIGMSILAMAFLAVPFFASTAKEKSRTYYARYLWLLLVPLIAIGLYLKLGSSQKVADEQKAQQEYLLAEAEIKKLGSIENIIASLKEKVTANPDSEGWFLLGRLYLKSQRFQEATHAFEKANQLEPNQPEVLLLYAESLYFANQQTLTPKAKQLLQEVLKLQPNQSDALNLLAQAKEKSADKHAVKLTVHVSLDKTLQKKVEGDETLFIYAQALKGTAAPLAIVRKKVKDLPLTITLDESMAMIPTATLANHKEVKVIARISKSGQAKAIAGDLMGDSVKIDTQKPPASIKVTINKQID